MTHETEKTPPADEGRLEPAGRPHRDMRCCWNCKNWHVREYIHCKHSGPWGGDIQGDPRCTFEHATRSQMLARHGFKRRSTRRSLPSDE